MTEEKDKPRKTIYLHFSGDIDDESAVSFFERINELEHDQDLTVYFSSAGGSEPEASTIIHTLNKEAHNRHVTLCFPWEICSAGFDVFLMTKEIEKTLFPSTWGMIHEASREFDVLRLKKQEKLQMHLVKNLDEINRINYKKYEDYGVSKDHLREMKKGEDVYLTLSDLEEILKFQKNNAYITRYNVLY